MGQNRGSGLAIAAGLMIVLIVILCAIGFVPLFSTPKVTGIVGSPLPARSENAANVSSTSTPSPSSNDSVTSSTILETTPVPEPTITSQKQSTPQLRLSGRVLDGVSQKGIGNARVRVHHAFGARFQEFLHSERPGLAEAETDDDGEYKLIVDFEPLRNTGHFMAVATASGYTIVPQLIRIKKPEEAATQAEYRQDFILGRSESISGIVVDQDDNPIEGATVYTILDGEAEAASLRDWVANGGSKEAFASAAFGPAEGEFTLSATSGPDGRFTLEGVPDRAWACLVASAEGFLPTLSEPVPSGQDNVSLVLKKGTATLSCLVVDSNRKPVQGALLMLRITAGDGVTRNGEIQTILRNRYGTTDDEGRHQFEGLAPGEYMVMTGLEEDHSDLGLPRHLILKAGDKKQLVMDLPAQVVLHGRAILRETDEPIPGVIFSEHYFSTDGPQKPRVVSGPDGRFELPLSPTRMVKNLYFKTSEDLACENLPSSMRGINLFDFPGFETGKECIIYFNRAPGLTVCVTVPGVKEFNPAPILSVDVAKRNGGRPMQQDGCVQLKLPKGPVTLAATWKDLQGNVDYVVKGEKDERVEIPLQQGCVLSARVMDSDNKPITNGHLLLFDGPIGSMKILVAMITGSDGTTNLGTYKPGKYNIQVELPNDSKFLKPEPVEFEIAEGEPKREIEIVLTYGSFIAGIVRMESGEPIAGASISVIGRTNNNYEYARKIAETDGKGEFFVTGLQFEAAVPTILVAHPEFETKQLNEVQPDGEPLQVVLKHARQVTVRIEGAQAGSRIEWKMNQESPLVSVNDWNQTEETTIRIPLPGSGLVRFEVQQMNEATGWVARSGFVEFPADSTQAEYTVTLRPIGE